MANMNALPYTLIPMTLNFNSFFRCNRIPDCPDCNTNHLIYLNYSRCRLHDCWGFVGRQFTHPDHRVALYRPLDYLGHPRGSVALYFGRNMQQQPDTRLKQIGYSEDYYGISWRLIGITWTPAGVEISIDNGGHTIIHPLYLMTFTPKAGKSREWAAMRFM